MWDLLLGAWLVCAKRPRRPVLAMLITTAAYLATFAVSLPEAFMLPMGGLVKNLALIPALAVLWVLVEKR